MACGIKGDTEKKRVWLNARDAQDPADPKAQAPSPQGWGGAERAPLRRPSDGRERHPIAPRRLPLKQTPLFHSFGVTSRLSVV